MTPFPTALSLLGMVVSVLFGGACSHVGKVRIPGSMAAAANDQIMLIRETPPSFGYRRMTSQVSTHPDLGLFVGHHGMPDFVAETGNRDRRYFILYYLQPRNAFACRIRSGRTPTVEFAGPYPITPREFRLLDGFRKDPSHAPTDL